MPARISLSIPILSGNEAAYVADCLQTGWISSLGRYVSGFEEQFAAYVGEGSQAAAVINGTSALHLALLAAGVQPDDEVLVPALTFIAPINAIRYSGAYPVFLDSSRESLGLCPQAVEAFIVAECEQRGNRLWNRTTGRPITALLPVHVLGHACQMDELEEIATRYNLMIIEDAAEGVGTYYRDRHVGSMGAFGCFSFNGNKVLSTGGGGMVISRNQDALARVRHLSTQAKMPGIDYQHDAVGYNYRLSNVHAAIGVAQLEHIDDMLQRKRTIHQKFEARLARFERIQLFREASWCRSNYWLALAFVPKGCRDQAIQCFLEADIETRPLWELNSRQPMFGDFSCGPIPTASEIHECGICIPCHAGLSDADIERICDVFTELEISLA